MAAHGHAKGVKLIADIMAGAALENGTAYDTLRLPLYKTWEEHATNYAAIRAELNPAAVRRRAACTCPGRAEVMAREFSPYLTRAVCLTSSSSHCSLGKRI